MTSMEPTDPGAPLEAIGPHTVELGPWRRRLIQFQRVAGGFMIFKGLMYWSSLFVSGAGPASYFQQQPIDIQATTVFFAVIDLIAGVALWLGSTWGAMLWLIAAAMQLFADAIVLELSGILILLTIIEVLLVAGYVIIRFMVHMETDRRR